jgi:uncharacterized protein (TIGR02217 family)
VPWQALRDAVSGTGTDAETALADAAASAEALGLELDETAAAAGGAVDATTGIVTFGAAPSAGVAITAGFEFDVPVRFDSDALDVTLDLERLGSITSIPLLEIRR